MLFPAAPWSGTLLQDGEVEVTQPDTAEEVPRLSWAELTVLYADGVHQCARGSWCQYLQRGGIQDHVVPVARLSATCIVLALSAMSIEKLTSVQETCVFWTRPSFTLRATSHQHCIEVRARRWCAPTSDDVDDRRRMGTPLVTLAGGAIRMGYQGKGKATASQPEEGSGAAGGRGTWRRTSSYV